MSCRDGGRVPGAVVIITRRVCHVTRVRAVVESRRCRVHPEPHLHVTHVPPAVIHNGPVHWDRIPLVVLDVTQRIQHGVVEITNYLYREKLAFRVVVTFIP